MVVYTMYINTAFSCSPTRKPIAFGRFHETVAITPNGSPTSRALSRSYRLRFLIDAARNSGPQRSRRRLLLLRCRTTIQCRHDGVNQVIGIERLGNWVI